MKKQLLLACMIASITACSSDKAPTYYQISNEVVEVPSSTIISVSSLNEFLIPEDSNSVVSLGGFKVKGNVYDSSGDHIVIPRNAVISGLYTNDGTSCSIAWKSVYRNEKKFHSQNAAFSVQNMASDSTCIASSGIKKGNKITLRFK